MPTEAKRRVVAELTEQIGHATLSISTNLTGLRVGEMTALRRHLRERSVEYRVVKNRLARLAAKAAGAEEEFTQLLEGSTGIVFGYAAPAAAARALDEYVRATRSSLVVRNGLMEGRLITAAQVSALASLPPKNELVATLLGNLQAPISRLVNVLSGPLRGLATVLERRAEQLSAQ